MKKSSVSVIVVFLTALVLCIANIWGYPITILDEAKNAEAAREMWINNALFPTFNDVLRTDKPPLHYFFMQLGYTLFGSNVFGARIFSALFGAGLITFVYIFLVKFSTLNIARITTLILLSSFFWIQEFHLAVPDPYLIFFLCTAWMLFYAFYATKKRDLLWLFYICVGLATLAKGPIAIGLSGLIVLVFLICKKEFSFKNIMSYRPFLGGLVVLLIALPWFVWIHIQTDGAFSEGFFLKHNFSRFSSEMEGHGGLFFVTWGFVLLGLFPFGLFIPQGIWHGYKFRKRSDLNLFSLIVAVVVILFFSISSTKLPNYTLPAMPFLAILVAGYFDEVELYNTLRKWCNIVSLMIISLVTLAIPLAVNVLFRHALLQHLNYILTLAILIVALIGLLLVWRSYFKKRIQALILSLGISWMFIGVCLFYFIYPNLARIEPVMQANDIVSSNEVVVFNNYDPSFNFNYQKVFVKFNNEDELIAYIQKHPEILVLTKDRAIKNKKIIMDNFEVVLDEPSVFENYRTMILRYNGKE